MCLNNLLVSFRASPCTKRALTEASGFCPYSLVSTFQCSSKMVLSFPCPGTWPTISERTSSYATMISRWHRPCRSRPRSPSWLLYQPSRNKHAESSETYLLPAVQLRWRLRSNGFDSAARLKHAWWSPSGLTATWMAEKSAVLPLFLEWKACASRQGSGSGAQHGLC